MNKAMEQPILTIAIPTYNGTKTIQCMLDLLLAQYDPRVEILISDNCSTDATEEIIGNYVKSHPYLKYYRNKENIGPDANFLQCMKLATGKYIHLLSDDDVMTEGALHKILDFLESNADVSLVYLYTVGFRGKYNGISKCSTPSKKPVEDICTSDRKVFMEYAGYYWGFMSSFVISKEKFSHIANPEAYFGTYWLQAYIYLLCCTNEKDKLGVVSYPCIGAGIYVNVNSFDTSVVDGINYKKMLSFAIEHSYFDKKQLYELYCWRILFLGQHSVIKEKAAGIKRTSKLGLFKCTWKIPMAWFKLYPVFFIPNIVCKWFMALYRKSKNMNSEVAQQRAGDITL